MVDLSEEEFAAATRLGEIEMATKPRAVSAMYDRSSQRLTIELANCSTFTFDPRLAQDLEHASDDQIAQVEILGAGFGLHWEELDADHSIEGLLAGRFGTRLYMAERFGPAWDAQAAE